MSTKSTKSEKSRKIKKTAKLTDSTKAKELNDSSKVIPLQPTIISKKSTIIPSSTTSLIILIVALLILASVFFLGFTIFKQNESTNQRLSDLESKSEMVNDIPAKTRNLLVYGDENTSTDSAKSTTIQGEPVMGNISTAKVAVVEYSDLNCPFCKRFATDTLPLIEDNYVNTGAVAFIHKDFPSVGGQESTSVHAIAQCLRQQKGDETYYDYIRKIYASQNSTSVDQALELAKKVYGIDTASLQSCSSDQAVLSEIQSDVQEASSLQFQGTPSFIVGRIVDGNLVQGEEIIGAQPYSVFQEAIERQLAK